MAKTYEEIKELASLIKNETNSSANTASRVGGTLFYMIEKSEENDAETKNLIKGQSNDTDPKTDPHKWLGEVAVSSEGQQQFNSLLNEMKDLTKVGYYRGSYGESCFEIETICTNSSAGNFVQCVRGSFSISSDKTTLQYGDTYKILKRTCKNNTWGQWEEYIITTDLDKKPGKIVAAGEIFNHESNSVGENGVNNHAEGQGTTCSGSCNHAEGMNTMAANIAAHSEGMNTTAGGQASHAEGMFTSTAVEAGHVEGKYNKVNDSVHVVGGGTSDTNRKNLHEIKKDGSQYMIGIGGFDGTNRDETKSVQESFSELDVNKLPRVQILNAEVCSKGKRYLDIERLILDLEIITDSELNYAPVVFNFDENNENFNILLYAVDESGKYTFDYPTFSIQLPNKESYNMF